MLYHKIKQSLVKPPYIILFCMCSLLVVFITRTLSLGYYPLLDTTEARYGEMVRIMLETGDWVTPQFNYGVPFLGKPPLFIWVSALFAKFSVVNEFSLRFASIIVSLITMFVTWCLANFQFGKNYAWLSITIIATTVIHIVLSGALVAEPVLLLSISLIISGFWIGMKSELPKQASTWRYVFFIGIAVGLLAKGLVVGILGITPIIIWCIYTNNLSKAIRKFPWFTGTILTLVIALPWYILAEIKNPGFLKYFIIGEHFNRYLMPSWEGDRYGHAHNEPLGYIWLIWLVATLPWSLIFTTLFINNLRKKIIKTTNTISTNLNQWRSFLYIAFFTPLIFFSFAHNIIWTYSFATVIPMGLLIALWAKTKIENSKQWFCWPVSVSMINLVAVIAMTIWLMLGSVISPQKQLLVTAYAANNSTSNINITYWKDLPFSGRFYSKGQAKICYNLAELESSIAKSLAENHYYIMSQNRMDSLPENIKSKFIVIKAIDNWLLLSLVNN
jgi:4-amino-4-deoxy-L-arabinose transferase-like glycosyltransferase